MSAEHPETLEEWQQFRFPVRERSTLAQARRATALANGEAVDEDAKDEGEDGHEGQGGSWMMPPPVLEKDPEIPVGFPSSVASQPSLPKMKEPAASAEQPASELDASVRATPSATEPAVVEPAPAATEPTPPSSRPDVAVISSPVLATESSSSEPVLPSATPLVPGNGDPLASSPPINSELLPPSDGAAPPSSDPVIATASPEPSKASCPAVSEKDEALGGSWTYEPVRGILINWRIEKVMILAKMDKVSKVREYIGQVERNGLDRPGFEAALNQAFQDIHKVQLATVLDSWDDKRAVAWSEAPDPESQPPVRQRRRSNSH